MQATKGLTVHLSIVAELDAEEIELLSGQSYEIDSRISFESLQDKYRQADVLMLCSTLEGFGMPIIEAQAMGRVVITSNVSSMPDVAGKGALLVDPLNINFMHSALEKIISDESLRKQLIEYGFENVKRFDKFLVSRQYYKLYKSI